MKYKFPKIDICLKHNLGYIYQGMEDFCILKSKNAESQESFSKNPITNEWILYSRRYFTNSMLITEELFDEKGDNYFVNTYKYLNNSIVGNFNDSTITWVFNKDNYLIKEERSYDNDGDSIWIFRMDGDNNLLEVNDYVIHKEENRTKNVYDSQYKRFTLKEIVLEEESRKIEATDFEDLSSTIYLDKLDRVVRRISNYNRETITEYLSETEFKTYRKDEKGNLNLVYEFREILEGNKRIKYMISFEGNIRDMKEITYLKI